MNDTTNKNRTGIRKVLLLSFISLLLLWGSLSGCGLLKKISGQQPEQEEQSEKVAKQLEEIEKTLEAIFMALDGPSIGTAEEGQSSQESQVKEDSSMSKSEGQDQEKPQEDQNGMKGSDGQEQGQDSKDPWQQVSQEIKGLHSSWNDYLPEVTKKGAKKEVLDGFSDALNNLTEITEAKDKAKTLLAANQLYASVPELYSLYKTKTPPELKRIIYYTRNSVLTSMKDDWSKASSDMEEIKSRWSLVKNAVGKEQQENSAKLDLSIYELEKVIKEENKDLVEIKGKLTLTNIEALQKAMEKGEGK